MSGHCISCGVAVADSSVYCGQTCHDLSMRKMMARFATVKLGPRAPTTGQQIKMLDMEFEVPAPQRSDRDIAIEKLARACTPFMPKHLRLEAHKLGLMDSAP